MSEACLWICLPFVFVFGLFSFVQPKDFFFFFGVMSESSVPSPTVVCVIACVPCC
eukprot:m.286152 g.286152  ORF g.286152 m.286152 type:complete len:55 (-) comp19437_c0_seq3:473-637(-)